MKNFYKKTILALAALLLMCSQDLFAVAPTSVKLVGDFNNWGYKGDAVMSKVSDYVYSFILELPADAPDQHFQLVINDGDGGKGWLGSKGNEANPDAVVSIVDTESGWVTAATDDFTTSWVLNHTKIQFLKYTVTAKWGGGNDVYKGWTISIQGKEPNVLTAVSLYSSVHIKHKCELTKVADNRYEGVWDLTGCEENPWFALQLNYKGTEINYLATSYNDNLTVEPVSVTVNNTVDGEPSDYFTLQHTVTPYVKYRVIATRSESSDFLHGWKLYIEPVKTEYKMISPKAVTMSMYETFYGDRTEIAMTKGSGYEWKSEVDLSDSNTKHGIQFLMTTTYKWRTSYTNTPTIVSAPEWTSSDGNGVHLDLTKTDFRKFNLTLKWGGTPYTANSGILPCLQKWTVAIEGQPGSNTGISEVKADATANAPVYDLAGRKMAASATQLPKGIYVVGGKKIAVR